MMTPERRKEYEDWLKALEKRTTPPTEHFPKYVVLRVRECLEEIDRLEKVLASTDKTAKKWLDALHMEQAQTKKLEEENRQARELLKEWVRWREKDVTYTGPNPSPFNKTRAFLDKTNE